jgi:hypothetical protein
MAIEDSLSALQISPHGPKFFDSLRNRWVDLRNDRSTRQNEYITLLLQMSVLRVDRGWNRPKSDVAFTVYSVGTVADSYTKRIVSTKTPPSPLRSNTDVAEFRKDNSTVYSLICDGWYIEKERD